MFSLVLFFGLWAIAQRNSDPNPDSPTPVLLTESGTTRALAQTRGSARKVAPTKIVARAFNLNQKVVLYVSDIQLMKDEGANAFRIYAQDNRGYSYRFPVLDIQPVADAKNMYAVTTLLTDEVGYFDPPSADGDVYVYLTWRGLASNKVKLGLGRMGGELKDSEMSKTSPPAPLAPAAIGGSRSADRQRFLEQATFGPTRAMDSLPTQMPLSRWINQQFNLPYPTFAYPAQVLKPSTPPANCDGPNGNTAVVDIPLDCYRDTYTMYPVQAWNSQEMLYGTAQLRHRVSWALSQIWVTSGVDVQQSRHIVEYHKIISANAFGNYRTLMKQMTLSPTMGDYLSMSQSTKTNPNENYAREIMQLFTVGLFMLNQDGTVQCVEHNPCQAGDTQVPTYDQNTVNNLTKVFTGWTFCPNGNAACPNGVSGTVNFIDPMLLTNTGNHDLTAKTLLDYPGANPADRDILACSNCTGVNSAANITAYANASLDHAIDNIFNHPNIGPYISKILIQQLVTSDPTPAYVSRVAAKFNNNGLGVRGDMKAVITAILLDVEARGNVKTDPNYGKLREPVLYAANILRAFNVRDAAGTGQSDGVIFQRNEYMGMGQIPFRSPTVFNYYPPNFIVPGTALLGPEFGLMTTGTTIQRTNLVNRYAFTAPAISGGTTDVPNGTSLDFADLQALITADQTGGLAVDELNRRLMHTTMSPGMRTTLLNSITGISNTDTLGKVRQLVYEILTSSQYQVQK